MAVLTNPFTGGEVTVPDDAAEAWVARGFRRPQEPEAVEASETAPAPRRKRARKSDGE